MTTEYITIKGNEFLIGKRARIKDNLKDYSKKLWGAKGTIRQLYQVRKGDLDHVGLSLVFDKPIDVGSWTPMKSVYLTLHSFEILGRR